MVIGQTLQYRRPLTDPIVVLITHMTPLGGR